MCPLNSKLSTNISVSDFGVLTIQLIVRELWGGLVEELPAKRVDAPAHMIAEFVAHGAALAAPDDLGLRAKVDVRRHELVFD